MDPSQESTPSEIGLVRLYKQAAAAKSLDDGALPSSVADIASRWEHVGTWTAPLRNPLWVESEEGTPVAAVSGSFAELTGGQIEQRRQAIAHAPSDIRALLEVIKQLRARSRASRSATAKSRPTRKPELTPARVTADVQPPRQSELTAA